MMEISIMAYDLEELDENLQMQIKESVAGELLRKYMDGKMEEGDLKEKVRKAVEADNYKLIKHGIMDLAHDYIETLCKSRMFLKDGTRII